MSSRVCKTARPLFAGLALTLLCAPTLANTLNQNVSWTIDRSGTPLSKLDDPIVSVFSTGVLEAAARGIPAWVTCTDPPEWLREFWSRYDMRPWGGAPTPAPTMSDREPALAVADVVREMMGP